MPQNFIYLLILIVLSGCNSHSQSLQDKASKIDQLLSQLNNNEQFNGGILLASR